MGIIKAFSGAISGTFADQWKDILVPSNFDEHSAVVPAMPKIPGDGRGTNSKGTPGVLTNGSKIYIPENTAAFIFSQAGIEDVITEPGGYEYQNGQQSVFNGDGLVGSIFKQAKERFTYGGATADEKTVAYVNLREIRDIKFGTRGPQMYNDLYYGTDLEIYAYGSFTIRIVDPVKFVRNYVPANVTFYTFDAPEVRSQILSEFLQSFSVALNSLSNTYRISQLPSQANAISREVASDAHNAGTWKERFGFDIVKIAIENIEFTEDSRQLVKEFSSTKMGMKAYDDVSQRTSDIAAQQKIAKGIQDNGLGDGAGMLFGMNLAQGLSATASPAKPKQEMSFDAQVEALQKLKGLLDAGILTQDEFQTKKKEIMGL